MLSFHLFEPGLNPVHLFIKTKSDYMMPDLIWQKSNPKL